METFETNLFGTVSVTKEFLRLLLSSDSGRIVNVSSTMGSLADQSDPGSPYHGLVVPASRRLKSTRSAPGGCRPIWAAPGDATERPQLSEGRMPNAVPEDLRIVI